MSKPSPISTLFGTTQIPASPCGPCTLCCKVLAVYELGKAEGAWCGHCTKKNGCRVYDHRPQSCQVFECLWVSGEAEGKLDPDLRPDRCRVIVAPGVDEEGVETYDWLDAHVDQSYPLAWRSTKVLDWLLRLSASVCPVWIHTPGTLRYAIRGNVFILRDGTLVHDTSVPWTGPHFDPPARVRLYEPKYAQDAAAGPDTDQGAVAG